MIPVAGEESADSKGQAEEETPAGAAGDRSAGRPQTPHHPRNLLSRKLLLLHSISPVIADSLTGKS